MVTFQSCTTSPIQEVAAGGRSVVCKLEKYNPSGSHKGHASRGIVEDLWARGVIRYGQQTRLIVPSSGNFAVGMCDHALEHKGVELDVVTDTLSPHAFTERLRNYPRVQAHVVNNPDETGSHIRARLEKIRDLVKLDPDRVGTRRNTRTFIVDQYDNPRVPVAYEGTLVTEFFQQMQGDVSAVFAAAGTCGLLGGFELYRRKRGLSFPIFAVDADGSCLARRPRHGACRRLPGYGNGIVTGLARAVIPNIEFWAYVEDHEAVEMCHRLVRRNHLLVGPSSGAILAAVEKVAQCHPELIPAGNIIAVLPDGGEVYADSIFDAEWLDRNKFHDLVPPVLNGDLK